MQADMKTILIFRHAAHEGPGYFADYLDRRGLRWRLIRVDRRDPVPTSIDGAAGLVFMGGPMSVNDPLPWIPRVVALIQQAVAAEVPVLGHCLGGQLMAKALGGKVTRNRIKEIGWLPVEMHDAPIAREWLNGLARRFEVFHWHGETFSIPPGATPILESRGCRHQAFVLGKHLAFQCHIEMTPALVRSWARTGAAEIAKTSRTVQSERQMCINLVARAERLNRIADRFYDRWIQGLKQ
jgi:GMP synthase-like glutamine amidotransferase